MTVQRSGSHFLANAVVNKLGGLVLTTSIERNNEPEVIEYRSDVIKRGLINRDNFRSRQGINCMYLFSHPHHFTSLQHYCNFLGEEKIDIVLSYPFDCIYSLFVATTQGYRETPTKETIQKSGNRTITSADVSKLIGYEKQVKFIRELFETANRDKVTIHKYEDMNDENISNILGQKVNNCGFTPDKNRTFWSKDFSSFSSDAMEKIEYDFKELIDNCYQF